MTRQVSLLVNDQPTELDYFVQGFIDHTTRGILAGLEGTGEFGGIENAQVSVRGEAVDISVRWSPKFGQVVKSGLCS